MAVRLEFELVKYGPIHREGGDGCACGEVPVIVGCLRGRRECDCQRRQVASKVIHSVCGQVLGHCSAGRNGDFGQFISAELNPLHGAFVVAPDVFAAVGFSARRAGVLDRISVAFCSVIRKIVVVVDRATEDNAVRKLRNGGRDQLCNLTQIGNVAALNGVADVVNQVTVKV